MRQKRIVTVQDLSCFGKCSLTISLPVISAAGIEACCVPTAVLSTHTGGLGKCTYRDLTEDIMPIARHWQSLGLEFDAVYLGYLGSERLLESAEAFADMFVREDTLLIIDPVMADNGRLYSGFTPGFAEGMARLCGRADVILPNLTEAAFLLGEEYRERYDRSYIEDLLRRLAGLGAKKVVLTGVSFEENKLGAAVYDSADGEMQFCFTERVNGYFHGTGDLFASVFSAVYVKHGDAFAAARAAAEMTCLSIKKTVEAGGDQRFGVYFEPCLPHLARLMETQRDI